MSKQIVVVLDDEQHFLGAFDAETQEKAIEIAKKSVIFSYHKIPEVTFSWESKGHKTLGTVSIPGGDKRYFEIIVRYVHETVVHI